MRDFLIGLLGMFVCAGCGPECGWAEFDDIPSGPPPAGKCAKLTIGGEGRITRAPANGCAVDGEGTKCVILTGNESAQAFLHVDDDRVFGQDVPGHREHAPLSEDGTCPLTCDAVE